jgi:two-component system, NarL family, response regulator DesR
MENVYTIMVVDDHPLIQKGVRLLLQSEQDLHLIATATDGDEAKRQVLQCKPDLLILDLNLPGAPPIEIITYVQGYTPMTKVLIMSAFADSEYVHVLHRLKVAGYILKDEAPTLLLAAIRCVLQGATWFSRPILEKLIALQKAGASHEEEGVYLTEQEQNILMAIGQGLNHGDIARELHLSIQTVRNYASILYHKIGVQSRAELIVWLQARGKFRA